MATADCDSLSVACSRAAAPGSAIGWEHGSAQWLAKRDEWIAAVQAAPRCKEVRSPLALPAGASVGASAGASTVLSARSTYTPLAPVSLLSSLPSPTGDAGGVDGHCYHAAGRGA